MRVKSILVVAAALAVAACERSPSGPVEQEREREGGIDPVLARAESSNCPSRCGHPLPIRSSTNLRVFRVTEGARVLGFYGNTRTRFTWSLGGGMRTTALDSASGTIFPRAISGNGWGQSVGVVMGPDGAGNAQFAAAWEPSGSQVFLRGSGGRRVEGRAEAINESSVIVGAGALTGESSSWRPFRYYYRDGVRFLTPAGTRGSATDVNEAGTIVGYYGEDGNPRTMKPTWFIWTPEKGRQDIGPGSALAISGTGYVVGMDADRGFLRSPEGETVLLPEGWRPVDVNRWGEVVLQAITESVLRPGDCGSAVWYRGYGLLRLTSPVAGARSCYAESINSWGDVVGTVAREIFPDGYRDFEHTPTLWTWHGNEYRYVR